MIDGALVRLRAREAGDLPYALRWFADPETCRWLLKPYGSGVYPAQTEPMTFADPHFTVVDRATGAVVGTAGLVGTSPENRLARLYVVVGEPAYRGRGYGADTVRTLCRFGFDAMNLAKVELEVVADHTRAVALYERLGFVREVHRRRALWIEGAWRDEYLMGVLPGELR